MGYEWGWQKLYISTYKRCTYGTFRRQFTLFVYDSGQPCLRAMNAGYHAITLKSAHQTTSSHRQVVSLDYNLVRTQHRQVGGEADTHAMLHTKDKPAWVRP
jgi:hypothetical protein